MEKEETLKGLGGWLIFVQIGFILLIFIELEFLFFPYGQSVIDFLEQVYHVPSLITVIFYSLIILFNVYALLLMHQEKKSFVWWAIFSLCYNVFINAILTFMVFEGFMILLFILGTAVLGIFYLKKSNRVKETFVRQKGDVKF